MKITYGLAIIVCAISALPARATDVASIIQHSVAATQADWKAAPDYAYLERDRKDDGTTKTYRVVMLQGSPYKYLLEANGERLSPEDQRKEQQKLEQAIQDRQSASPGQRKDRIAQYQKQRRRDHLMMEQLAKAFDFKLIGEQKLDGFNVYKLSAEPRPGYQPPNTETTALTGMRGEMWVDQKTYQWVKVQARVVHPVSVEGFLARIEPGTRFELEKMPVGDGIWLAKHFSMQAHAKILFIIPHNKQETETYWDYQKHFSLKDIGNLPTKKAPGGD